MGSIPNDFRISLQSWPSKHNDPNSSLPGLIQRINFERGSFREISEESLQQEIAEEEARKNGDDDNGTSEEEDEEEEKPDRLKELMKARDELIVQIEYVLFFATEYSTLIVSQTSSSICHVLSRLRLSTPLEKQSCPGWPNCITISSRRRGARYIRCR